MIICIFLIKNLKKKELDFLLHLITIIQDKPYHFKENKLKLY